MALTQTEKRQNAVKRKTEKQAMAMEMEMFRPQTLRIKGKSGGKSREQAENNAISGFQHTLYIDRILKKESGEKEQIPMELLPLKEQIKIQNQRIAERKKQKAEEDLHKAEEENNRFAWHSGKGICKLPSRM